MERHLISRIAHTDHPIAAPLSDESVERLLDRATRGGAERMLDLGCGEAPWLLRALAARPKLRAVGVDLDAEALTLARRSADALGVARRLGLHHQDAREFSSAEPFDVVLCVGATHAFGGLLPTLAAVREHLAPGGVAVVGDCFWEREPSRAALDELGGIAAEEYADLPTTVERVVAEGWTPVQGHVSSLQEWDDYEWAWTGSLAEWALDNPGHPESEEAATVAAEHRHGWLSGYRGTLGFVTLLLRRTAA
ncbi:class I SAM-dependent methyltransferase [Kitasatospora atroaurantiaca]|uniref:Methyltransferase family protein n=1 Tax=Kitasatospora atroaurantiaca TaxID=285545 RepID=A0A561EKC5_9ACTN|nr:class I SAM-dependent methyltransferase [Kitasatospora atroaurantiaca]TWE16066.1 methyltransferase family protein [Kitasatospora atroaurantiaca]